MSDSTTGAAHSRLCLDAAVAMAYDNGAQEYRTRLEWIAIWDADGGLENYGACSCHKFHVAIERLTVAAYTARSLSMAELLESPPAVAAGAAWDAVMDLHSLYADGSLACKCGQTFRRTQAFGQHLGAARRRAAAAHSAAFKSATHTAQHLAAV